MGKNKLARFKESESFPRFFQYKYQDIINHRFPYKGKWHEEVFKNSNPITLEVGCGRAEYTTGLARQNPDKNYIGIDRKGARLWRGGKTMVEENLINVAFIRTNIDFINFFFEKNEVDEIWLTFPDPQPKREKRRLTHPFYLEKYKSFLKPGAVIHLKTDSLELHLWTKEILEQNRHPVYDSSLDIYKDGLMGPVTEIKTTYEKKFLAEGKTITYLKFGLK